MPASSSGYLSSCCDGFTEDDLAKRRSEQEPDTKNESSSTSLELERGVTTNTSRACLKSSECSDRCMIILKAKRAKLRSERSELFRAAEHALAGSN
eukprot:7949-Heterococcus_DN1.PRE.3